MIYSEEASSKRESRALRKRGLFVIPTAYLFGIMTLLGLLIGWQDYELLQVWRKPHIYFSEEIANQLIDCYVWSFIALLIWQLMRWFPLQGPKWKRDLAVHLVVAPIMAPVATLLYIAGIAVTGLGLNDMNLSSRLKMNLHGELVPNSLEYLTILAILASVEYYRTYRDAQEETLHLQRALTESKLQALRAQLNPHFLFNALNSVSCLVHRDSAAADRMLSSIANLLRLTLARDDSREVGLLEEVELAEEYLEIQKIRFGARLQLNIDIADEALDARVPSMLLQPLVENACVHGVAHTRGECHLEIDARPVGRDLVIGIYNDGPRAPSDWRTQSGIGLRNTAERLALLYGENATLELASVRQGVRVLVRLPFHASHVVSEVGEQVARQPAIRPAILM